MATTDGSQIFALIVGINKYESAELNRLYGCVNDATGFKDYLRDNLKVPENNIKLLTDENAKRTAILDFFDSHLLNNPKINKENSPILIFYYAGHGGRVPAPTNWTTRDGNIETICPVDDFTHDANGKMIIGIPDITLNVKLDQLAREKGDNIVVVFDCCHAGGAARDPKSLPDNVRVRLGVIDYGEDVDFSDDEKKSWEVVRDSRDSNRFRRPHRSYILLAACQDIEYAHETEESGMEEDTNAEKRPFNHSGIFTTALLKHLKQYDPTSQLTYLDLMESVRIDLLPKQCPTCYGFNKDRWLFRLEARSQLYAEPAFVLENLNGIDWDRVTRDYRFTIAGPDNTTYQLVPDQTPSVLRFEQYPKDSAMFGSIDINKFEVSPPPSRPIVNFPVCRRIKFRSRKHLLIANPAFIVRVGGMHCVDMDSRFTIPLDKDSRHAELKVHRIEPQCSILVFRNEEPVSYKNISADAIVSWIADLSGVVRIHLKGPGFEDVVETPYFQLVDHDADVVVSLHAKEGSHLLRVQRYDPLILQLVGIRGARDFDEVDMNVENVADIPAILNHIARFHYYLGWSTSSKDRIKALGRPDDINLHLHKLITKNGTRAPQDSTDYFVDGPVDTTSPYGIKISKDTDGCVYLSLFSFDPRTYEIELHLQSNDTNDCLLGSCHQGNNTIIRNSANGRSQFTAGYGPGGGNPLFFRSGGHFFFKLFASGNYCDWSFIEQGDVSGVTRGRERGRERPRKEVNFKGAWVVGVMTKDS